MGKAVSLFLFWIFWGIAFEAAAAKASTRRCPPIEGNNLKVRIKSRGRVAKFKCRKGYTMFEGDRFATCVRGQWNGKIPKCITPGCEFYDRIPHGETLYLYNDALVQFLCMPGYSLEGSPALTCDGDHWNATKPVCQAPSNAALTCDFEDAGICGWMNDEVDHFDWSRNQGPAGAFGEGTGPKTDHTLGTALGHYMYIESSIPKDEGDKARLFSPVYPASVTDQSACFAFYFHMFGHTTGNLNVYLKGESDDIESLPPIFQMSGYNSDKWNLHVLDLDKMTTDFQIVLEGVHGIGYTSDIAIDDVQLAQGDACDRLEEEFQKQYSNSEPETTKATTSVPTTMNQPTTLLPVSVSGISSNATPSLTTIQSPVVTINQTITTTKAPASPLTTSVSVQQFNQTTTTIVSLKTTTTGHDSEEEEDEHDHNHEHESDQDDEQEHEDLNSCQNRCGEIAVESNTCGCDIVCNNSKTCCPDIQKYCPGYFTTPPPVTLLPRNVTASLTTVSVPVQIITTKPSPTSITNSGSDDTKSTATPVSADSSSQVMSKTTTTAVSTQAATTPAIKPQSSENPTSTVKPMSPVTAKRPADLTVDTTLSESVTTKVPPIEPSLAVTLSTTPEPKRSDDKTPPSKGDTTKLSLTTIPGIPKTTEVTSLSVLTEKITETSFPATSGKTFESTAAPSTGSERSSGLSQTSVFAIAIGTTTAIILLVILAVAYIRKRRRDKLPEDSDIRFLARDEVMMEGNVFNLSGTISHVRNTAI